MTALCLIFTLVFRQVIILPMRKEIKEDFEVVENINLLKENPGKIKELMTTGKVEISGKRFITVESKK